MKLKAIVVASVLAGMIAAGCHEGNGTGDESVAAGESLQLGESLFHLTREKFVAGMDAEGRGQSGAIVTAKPRVEPEHDLVGVKLLGDLQTDDSTVQLTVTHNATGAVVYDRTARRGGEDRHGTIEGFFYIIDEFEAPPGEYAMRLEGKGRVGHMTIGLTGVDVGSVEGLANETFAVEEAARSLRFTLSGEGWGPLPTARLRGPDGQSHALSLPESFADQEVLVRAVAGDWTVELDARGFGGSVSWVVRAVT